MLTRRRFLERSASAATAASYMDGWDRALAARSGMAFSNEPGIYIRGELLTPPSRSLDDPCGW